MRGAKVVSLLAGVAAAAVSGAAHAIAWYFQSPASRLAQDIDQLHRYVMWLIIVIFVGVFGFMFYACYAHRKSKGHKAEQFHENTTVEILWTVIPAAILIVIAWPTTRVVVAQKNTSAPELTVKVTGYQKALAAKADLAGSKVVTGPEEAQSDVQPAEVKARRR